MPVIKLGGPKKISHLKYWASSLPTLRTPELGEVKIFNWIGWVEAIQIINDTFSVIPRVNFINILGPAFKSADPEGAKRD